MRTQTQLFNDKHRSLKSSITRPCKTLNWIMYLSLSIEERLWDKKDFSHKSGRKI